MRYGSQSADRTKILQASLHATWDLATLAQTTPPSPRRFCSSSRSCRSPSHGKKRRHWLFRFALREVRSN
ncbi:hypothetical protein RISK_001161 [Rhodopirellula islandica]|uniref:Uncharacterized protein n=1 Tax=Rhodopirellula islandica TaxID=595434 RepID=A0A0J1BK10_RHOIS|nr:hypothetical protein RISK_001161 [Rhodopirellula islandica]